MAKLMIGLCPIHDTVKADTSYSPYDGTCFRCAICGRRVEKSTAREITDEEFEAEYEEDWNNKR